MSAITDLIAQQVAGAAGKIELPENIKGQVMNGLSDSILGSLTQTAMSKGGADVLKSLLTGKTSAASSPVTALAGQLFAKNVVKNLRLNSTQNSALSALIPTIIGKLSSVIKDQDGDGDVDINDIIITLTQGGGAKKSGSILGSVLGGFLKK